jgi:hypothetical protein
LIDDAPAEAGRAAVRDSIFDCRDLHPVQKMSCGDEAAFEAHDPLVICIIIYTIKSKSYIMQQRIRKLWDFLRDSPPSRGRLPVCRLRSGGGRAAFPRSKHRSSLVEYESKMKARATIHEDFKLATVDDRIFSAFLEHLGRTIYGGSSG